MKKTLWMTSRMGWAALIVAALVLTACGSSATSTSAPSGSADSSGGTHVTNRAEPPADYASKVNPFAGKADAVTAGKAIFSNNCATCHGDSGKGDGPSASVLNPKPGNLTYTAQEANDAYIHWIVSEGGDAAKLSNVMPSFKGTLSDDQIWQVTSFVKSLK